MLNRLGSGDAGRKKVLVIARSFPPFRTVGSSIRVVKFIKYLPSLGWLPVVLTIDDKKEYESQRKQGSAVLLPEIPPQVKVYRTAAAEPTLEMIERIAEAKKKRNLAGILIYFLDGLRRWVSQCLLFPDPYITWLPAAVWQGRKIVRREGIDVIFATCPAYSVSLIAVLIKNLTRLPLILDFRDDWIDTPFFHSKPRATRSIERWLERWAIRNSERVLLVTQCSKEAFIARYPREPKDKFVFLPNGCDLDDYAVDEKIACERKRGGFIVVHAGLLVESTGGPYRRSPRAFFQAVHDLREEHPELGEKLSVLFTGRLPEATRRIIEEFGLSCSIHELGDLPAAELVRLFREADLLLAINYDDWETIIPGKVYEYWAAAGPPVLLLSCPGAARDLVEQYHLGITVDSNDSGSIAQAIWKVYQRREAGAPMRVNSAGIEMYDRKVLANRLAQILVDVSE